MGELIKPINPVNVNNSVSYVREFPINLNNVPSGNGYYQQLITIGNASYPYSNYNINSQGSNIQFISQNNSYLYAWVQNINTTTISVWIKNFNSSNLINMQVFPEFENLFSANGYLGEAPELSSTYGEYDNGKSVFASYNNFAGTSGNSSILDLSAYPTSQYIQDNGLTVYANTTSTLGSYIEYPSNILVTDVEFSNPVTPSNIFPSLGFANFNGFSSGGRSNYVLWNAIGSTVTNKVPFLYNNVSNPLYLLDNEYYTNVSYNGQTASETDNTSFTTHYLTFQNQGVAIAKDYVHIYYLAISNVSGNFNMPNYSISNILYPYYILNINSYNQYSNPIKNYYYYNNSVETELNFTFKSYVNNLSILPLNYSNYYWNKGNISISESDFKELNFSTYQYNLSIYYNFLNSNFINPYSLSSYLYPISVVLTFIIGGLIMIGYIKYGKNGDKH